MKQLRQILMGAFLLLSGLSNAQNCSGDFTWLVNGMNVSFYGTSSPGVNSVVWSFGDGNYDYNNSLYTNHTYTNTGTYTACITVIDSVNNCSDSTCYTVVLDSCYGYFTYSMNGVNGNFYGNAVGVGPNVVYQWNFGDNQTSSLQNPAHTYAQTGNYTVCFSYYDPTIGCSDSVCLPVSTGGCYADFASIDSMGYVFFINQSSLGQSGSYYWDFGDGGTSTQYNPAYSYAIPGTYQVCLIAVDSMQNFCDSTCHMVASSQAAGISESRNGYSFSTFPNPAQDEVNVSFTLDENTDAVIALFDMEGREIQQLLNRNFTAGQHSEIINTAGIPSGTYFLRMQTEKQIVNAKLVIVKQL